MSTRRPSKRNASPKRTERTSHGYPSKHDPMLTITCQNGWCCTNSDLGQTMIRLVALMELRAITLHVMNRNVTASPMAKYIASVSVISCAPNRCGIMSRYFSTLALVSITARLRIDETNKADQSWNTTLSSCILFLVTVSIIHPIFIKPFLWIPEHIFG